MIDDWKLQARSRTCTECREPFCEGQTYRSLLVPGEGGSMLRHDLCASCWERHSDPARAEPLPISSWQGVFAPPPAPRPLPLQFEVAEQLLRLWLPNPSGEHRNACYILSAMLERKRKLLGRGAVSRDGSRYLLFEHATTGESFVIEDPQLRLEDLERVQQQVLALLAGAAGQVDLSEAPAPDAQDGFPPREGV